MSTREEDRKNRRVEDGCLAPSALPACDTAPNSRRVEDPCGDLVLPNPCDIDLSKFLSPENLPAELSNSPALPYIELDSEAATVTCADKPGTTGTVLGASVSASLITARVYLSGISDLTPLQRRHLATISQPDLNNWPSLTTSEVMEAGQLTGLQASQLLSAVSAAQDGIDAASYSAALAALDCYYENVAKTATCEVDIDGVAATTSVSNPVTVSAGLFQSSISQADADALALASAEAQLNCVWFNTEQRDYCDLDPNSNAVPNSFTFDGSNSPTPETQVGQVTVNAGVVSSSASRADANRQALELARGFLNCFFLNTTQTATCDPDEDDVAADAALGTVSATVDAGVVPSTVGVADANATALAIAESRLVCRWGNTTITRNCNSEDNPSYDLGKDALDVYHNASPTVSVVFSATSDDVATFVSEISRADANQQALTFVVAQLDCAWCSDAIEALCTTDGSIDQTDGTAANAYCASSYLMAQDLAVVAAAIPTRVKVTGTPTCRYANNKITAKCYPEPGVVSKYNSTEAAENGPLSSSSAAQFIIVAAGAVVSIVSTADATNTAENLALAQLDCFWENTAQSCPAGADGVSVAEKTVRSYTSRSDANTVARGLLFCEVKNIEKTEACPPDSASVEVSSNAISTYTTPAGLFRDAVDESALGPDVIAKQAAVNALAENFALQQLDCFWENAALTLKCYPAIDIATDFLAQESRSPDTPATIDIGDGKFDGVAIVDSGASGSPTKPVEVLARSFRSYASQAEANSYALTTARSQLNCFYYNTLPKTGSCELGLVQLQLVPPTVAAGTVRSEASLLAANSAAQTLADALIVCSDPETITGGGTAGPAGPAGNCTNPCGAYYS